MKWDLYDKDFKLVGKTIEETQNDEIPDGLLILKNKFYYWKKHWILVWDIQDYGLV